MDYSLLDAIRKFQSTLKTIDQDSLEQTYQRIATEANEGDLGQAIDAKQGLCVAMQAEIARRHFMAKEE
jgi:transketolase N-terminal domain/subunit